MNGANRGPAKIVIIGDRFMTPSIFEKAIRACCSGSLAIEAVELPWPDEPMLHGYAAPGLEGLKEYQGDPDDIVRLAREAEIVVTQLAPFSATMLERLPKLRLIVAARGGPVNIDVAAARRRNVRRRQRAGAQCLCGGRIHHRRHPGRDPAHRARP